MTIHQKLISAATQYDEKQSKKKFYNPWALPQYIGRIQEISADLDKGADLRKALVTGLNGRLLDICLKAVGLPTSTKEEQRGL